MRYARSRFSECCARLGVVLRCSFCSSCSHLILIVFEKCICLLGCQIQITKYNTILFSLFLNLVFEMSSIKTDVVKFKTYALTLRPRNGITEQQVEAFVAWIRKRSEHYHVVSEKTGHAKHVHAALYLKVSVSRSNFCVVYSRLLKKFGLDVEETVVASKGVKILYNNDFVLKYLDKDDDTVVIASCLPEVSRLESFYPPKPEVNSRAEQHSQYYWRLEVLWFKYTSPEYEVHTANARDFLFKMMYSERCIAVIKDDRQIIQVARHLTRWLKRSTYSTIELPPFEKEE